MNDISSVLKQLVLKDTTEPHNEQPKYVITIQQRERKVRLRTIQTSEYFINQQTSNNRHINMQKMQLDSE